MRNRVRVMCKPGSVGDLGGQPPRSTRPREEQGVLLRYSPNSRPDFWSSSFFIGHWKNELTSMLFHHCHIFEMNGESYRFRESMKPQKSRKSE